MVTFVLDASAIMRYLDRESGAQRVAEVLRGCASGRNKVLISSIQWGELAYLTYMRKGENAMQATLAFLLSLGVEVVPATPDRAVKSGILKAKTGLPYADAFCIELAGDFPHYIVMTADFDFKSAGQDVQLEFLPANPKQP